MALQFRALKSGNKTHADFQDMPNLYGVHYLQRHRANHHESVAATQLLQYAEIGQISMPIRCVVLALI